MISILVRVRFRVGTFECKTINRCGPIRVHARNIKAAESEGVWSQLGQIRCYVFLACRRTPRGIFFITNLPRRVFEHPILISC